MDDQKLVAGVTGIACCVVLLFFFFPIFLIIVPLIGAVLFFAFRNSKCDAEVAVREGADLIEFDIALTKDGVAILMHDDDLDRTTNLTGAVKEKTLNDLKATNLAVKFTRKPNSPLTGSVPNECVPTLEAVIQWSVKNNIRLLFDVKDYSNEMVAIILRCFEQYNLYRRAIVCSFFPWVVYKVKRCNPNILTGLTWRQNFFSYSDLDGQIPRYKGLKQMGAEVLDRVYLSTLLTILPLFLGVDLLLTHVYEISMSFVAAQRAKGLQVAAWTVNDMLQASWMIESLGLPLLTDFPFLSEHLKRLGKFVRNGYN